MAASPAAHPETTQPAEPAPVSPNRRNLIFVAVVLGMLLAALDQTIVATALPTMVADLGGAGHQAWVVTSYLLASTIVTAVVGKLGDLFGRRTIFAVAVVFFLIGSVLCGIASSMEMLVASRALQGVGGGALMVTAAALIGEVIPLRDRGRYQGALGAVFGVTTVVGPLLGGYFTDHLTWRWAFWINVPIGIVVLIVALTTIPALRRRGRPVIDYAGIVLIGLGASGLTLATSWGGSTYAWSSPVIIGLFIGSGIALALFVRVELRAVEPVLPIRLFASPVFTVCCILSFIVGFAMLGALTFLPTFMQFVDGVSATESGLRTLPMVGGLLLTSMGSGVLVSRTGRYKIFPVAGTAVMVVGFVLLSQMDATTPMLQQSAYLFILGTGIGMCMQVLILIVQSTAKFSDLGVATSGVTFFRTIGSSFGAAIFGSLFANFLDARIVTALAGGGAPAEAAQSPQVLHRLPDTVAGPIVEAYSDSLGLVFLYAAPVALLGFLVALTLKQVPLQEFEASAALDMGEGFGMPSTDTPEKMLETAVGRLVRQSPEIRLRSIAGTRGCESDVALLWALIQIYRQSQVFGSARLTEMAERLRVPPEVLEPTFDRLVECGHALRTGDQLWLTQSGAQQVDAASSALVGRIVAKLEASPAFEGRPDRGEVEAALERIALRLLVQRDWEDDRAELPTGGN
ncbi:MDR family MFS transporter [Mycolicibacterium austroafricanum]|uniref:MDR family MFS transporter n=1 Tax=Mycolicibacterium austroafricanum TaxID=39687 RepID=UPI001CA328DE|nr:MDR family MFS transporter [Mycolicibacterium austroafricanum]QZT64909.1 MFS transporter [Mycolicibacterium austroafricanum]